MGGGGTLGLRIGPVVAAAVLLASGCAGSGSAEPAAPPASTAVAAAAVTLAPADLAGRGWRAHRRGSGAPMPAWPWALTECVAYDAADYPAQQHRRSAAQQRYRQRPGRELVEQVERYEPGWGARGLADARRVIEACPRYESSGRKADFLASHTIVAESFAGDEALLVESTRITPPSEPADRHTAVVRRGDVVVTITATGLDADEVRRLATLAASRLG